MSDKMRVFEQTAFTPEEQARQGMRVLAEYLKIGTEALQRMAILQSETDARLKRLERMIALEKRMTQGQAGNIWRAIRKRAGYLCEKNGLPANRLGKMSAARRTIQREIRLDLYKRFGVNKVDAIPQVEYRAAIELVDAWMNLGVIGQAIALQEKEDTND